MNSQPVVPAPVEYTPEAIDERFQQLEAIRKLAVSLRAAGDAARRQGLSDSAQTSSFSLQASEHEQR